MSCVIFGAGKIARGFIGHLLYLSNIPVTYVEKVDSLVDLLNERGHYTVNVLGAPEKNTDVKGYKALHYRDEAEVIDVIVHADCVFHAVGGKNLAGIAPLLAKGIEVRAKTGKPLNIITCENWTKPDEVDRANITPLLSEEAKKYFEEKVGIAEAVILRSGIDATPEQKEKDPLWVNVQNYWDLPFDSSKLKAPMPNGMICLHPMPDFGGFLQRKFYTYNAANGTTSYVGSMLGYIYIAEAAHDERILKLLDGVYHETAAALCKKQNYSFDKQWAFTRTSLNKLQDYNIVDTLERNARDPIRKLGPNDRLVGSARLCLEEGVKPEALSVSIAAAIYYHSPSDPIAVDLENMRKTEGVDYVLEHVCQIDPNGELALLVKDKINMLKGKGYIHD